MEKLTNLLGAGQGQPKRLPDDSTTNAVNQLKQLFEEMGMSNAFSSQQVVNALVYAKGDVDKAMDVLLSGAV